MYIMYEPFLCCYKLQVLQIQPYRHLNQKSVVVHEYSPPVTNPLVFPIYIKVSASVYSNTF